MATIIEPAQRMLTKRPTVARTSDVGMLLVAKSPTRASEPRTEITRPKDVTAINPSTSRMVSSALSGLRLDKLLSPRRFPLSQIGGSRRPPDAAIDPCAEFVGKRLSSQQIT